MVRIAACRFEELVIVARYHAVVELADLVGVSAEEAWEILVRRKNIDLPRRELLQGHAKFPVELFRIRQGHEPFAVRWIGDDCTAAIGVCDRTRIAYGEIDVFFHSRAHRCVFGDLYAHRINIGAACPEVIFHPDRRCRLLTRITPDGIGKLRIPFGCKTTVQAGRDMTHLHGGLDQDRTGTAEGIPQKHILARTGHPSHRGGKRFPDRRRDRFRTIAALVERFTGQLQHQIRMVLKKKELDPIFGACLRQCGQTVLLSQTNGHCLFDDPLAVWYGEKCGFDRVTGYGKNIVSADKVLPWQGFRTFKQLVKGTRLEAAKRDIQPFRVSKPDIRSGTGCRVSTKMDSAVHSGLSGVAERVNLLAKQAFQTEHTRGCIQIRFGFRCGHTVFSPFRLSFLFSRSRCTADSRGDVVFCSVNEKRHHLPYSLSTQIFSLCASMIVRAM